MVALEVVVTSFGFNEINWRKFAKADFISLEKCLHVDFEYVLFRRYL